MEGLCPYEIVASIVCRPDDHVMCRERFERVLQNRTWQMWAVAVEGNNASLVTLCEVRKYRRKARSKAFIRLGNYARSLTCQTSQFVDVRIRAHDGNIDTAQ